MTEFKLLKAGFFKVGDIPWLASLMILASNSMIKPQEFS